MQTWILTGVLVLSLFANGYLFAQRSALPMPAAPDVALMSELQRLVDELDAEPEWRYRLVSLGRFAAVRDERRQGQRQLLTRDLYGLLASPALDYDELSLLLENLGHEDAHYRTRVVEQFLLLLRDLDGTRRMMFLERLRLLDLDLDAFDRFGRLQP